MQQCFLIQWRILIKTTRLGKKGMTFELSLSFPETMGGTLTNHKGSVFVGNWICAYPLLGYPTLGMCFNRIIEYDNWQVWGMVHKTPMEWTCLCYSSITWQYKAFYLISTILSKRSLKGKSEKYNMGECMFFTPSIVWFPCSTPAVLCFAFLLMEQQPQYKNRSERN